MVSCECFPIPGLPFLDVSTLIFQKTIDRNHSPITLYFDPLAKNNCVLKEVSLNRSSEQAFKKHILIYKFLIQNKNPNIMEYTSVCIKKQLVSNEWYRSLVIKMEFVDKNLLEFIVQRKRIGKKFTAQEIKEMMLQVLDGLGHLQNVKISHRDIKPQNIMVKEVEGGQVIYKLCDFENAIIFNGDYLQSLPITTFEYTPYSMLKCLQMNENRVFDPHKIDVFALGITCLKMCSMGRFTERERISQLLNKHTHQKFIKEARDKYIKFYNDEEMNFMTKLMLEIDEYRRDDSNTLMIRIEEHGNGKYGIGQRSILRRKGRGGKQTLKDERQGIFLKWVFGVQMLIFILFSIF